MGELLVHFEEVRRVKGLFNCFLKGLSLWAISSEDASLGALGGIGWSFVEESGRRDVEVEGVVIGRRAIELV